MIAPEDYPWIGTIGSAASGPLPLFPPQSMDRTGILLLVERTPPPEPRVAFGDATLRLAVDGRLDQMLNWLLPDARAALRQGAVVDAHFRDIADKMAAAFTCQEIASRRSPAWNRSLHR